MFRSVIRFRIKLVTVYSLRSKTALKNFVPAVPNKIDIYEGSWLLFFFSKGRDDEKKLTNKMVV